MARHFATIQNKTTNSADVGGRLTIFQSPSIFGGRGKPAYRSPVQSSGSFRFDCRHSAALRLVLAAGKMRRCGESSGGPRGAGGRILLTEAVRCCTVRPGDKHGEPHLA